MKARIHDPSTGTTTLILPRTKRPAMMVDALRHVQSLFPNGHGSRKQAWHWDRLVVKNTTRLSVIAKELYIQHAGWLPHRLINPWVAWDFVDTALGPSFYGVQRWLVVDDAAMVDCEKPCTELDKLGIGDISRYGFNFGWLPEGQRPRCIDWEWWSGPVKHTLTPDEFTLTCNYDYNTWRHA